MAGQNGPRGLIACAPCSSPQTRQQRGMLHSREAFPAEAASAAAAADGAKRPARPGRDPTHFPTILTYLRDGHVPLPEASLERQQLRAEAAFYSLTELVAAIDDAEAARAEEAAAERAKQEEAAQAARYVASHRVELLRGANEAVAHAEATLRQLQASQEAGRAAQRRVEERARRLQARGGRANTRLPRAVQPRGGVMQGHGGTARVGGVAPRLPNAGGISRLLSSQSRSCPTSSRVRYRLAGRSGGARSARRGGTGAGCAAGGIALGLGGNGSHPAGGRGQSASSQAWERLRARKMALSTGLFLFFSCTWRGRAPQALPAAATPSLPGHRTRRPLCCPFTSLAPPTLPTHPITHAHIHTPPPTPHTHRRTRRRGFRRG